MMTGNGIAIAHGWQQTGTPPVPPCFRYATLNGGLGTTFSFSGWTINGVDFESNYVAQFAAQGCTSNSPYTNQPYLADPHEIIVWYMGDGTADPSFTILNNLGDPISLTWSSICQKTCYELVVPSSDSLVTVIDVMGTAFTSVVVPSVTFSPLDVSIPVTVSAAEAYYKQCCGTDTTITSTLVGTDYVVQIKDAYILTAPAWTVGSLGTQFFYEITC